MNPKGASNTQRRPLRNVVTIALAGGLLAGSAPAAFAEPNPNPGIVPPHAVYQGLTYGEWMTRFNQWSLSVPASVNPLLVGNEAYVAQGQAPHLWFLGNTEPVVDRRFVVPAGTALFALVIGGEFDNALCVDPDTAYTTKQLYQMASDFVESITDIAVEIDGVPVQDVTQYRATSPEPFSSTLPDGNWLQAVGCADALPGTYGPMVADGYALILPPLPVGEHTIHETMLGFVDVTWRITVVPNKP